ncbi:MAG: hypothetical protein ACYTGH_16000 [Planctomycetota bacterium]
MKASTPGFRPLHWFHRSERSTVTVGYLVIAMTLYATVAGVFNTGVMVNQKIKTQVVADATAHGAATRIAAAINEMAMLNMLALRTQAARIINRTCIATSVLAGIVIAVIIVVAVVRLIASWGTDGSAWKDLALAAVDTAALIAFIKAYSKAKLGDLDSVYRDLKNRQRTLANNLTNDLWAQAKLQEDYLTNSKGVRRTNLYLSHPDSAIYPVASGPGASYLFTPTDMGTRALMLASRIVLADAQWLAVSNVYKVPDPDDSFKFPVVRKKHNFYLNFKHTWVKNAVRWGMYGFLVAFTLVASFEQWGYKMRSQRILSEWSANRPSDRRMLQVVAVAERTDSRNTFMAKGFFKQLNPGNSVMAVAQAEAGNPYDEVLHNMLGSVPLINQMITFPWRLWSSLGVNYQGRLSRVQGDDVNDALRVNARMKAAWEANTGGRFDSQRKTDVFLH